MTVSALLFAYLSPDTCMPLTSLLATVVGVVLVFGRSAWLATVRTIVGLVIPGPRTRYGSILRGPHQSPSGRSVRISGNAGSSRSTSSR
jgi:hypothetical protein